MFYFFIRILTLCIVSVTIYGADVVECQFSKQNQNDTDAVIWKITIPTEVAQKFNVYKNFLPENDNNEPIPYIYSADMHPYLTKTIVEKLFNLAANKENSSLITSPAEVEHMARVANMLEATQEINELLLRTKPAEQFIQELFAPAPKRWHNWFTYHIQSTDDGTNDLRLYVSTTIAQSPELKKHYKPLFYNWLYTCPEWQKADATLTTLKPIKKHVEIPLFRDYNQNDSDNPAFEPSQLIIQITDQIITYYPTQTLCSDLQKWKDSNLFKSYAAVFPEDKLTTLYEEHLSELLNMRDQCIQEKTFYYNNNKYPESFYTKFGITDRWKDLRPFPIKKYADSIHLPFLIHFVQYGVFLLANDRNINRITVLENDCNADTVQIPVVLKKVDVQTLQKIISKTNYRLNFECPLNPDSLPLLQQCSGLRSYLPTIQFSKVGTSIINACVQKTTPLLKNSKEYSIPSPQWRFKIIEPWVILSGLLATAGILSEYSFSHIDQWLRRLENNNWIRFLEKISALNISQSQYNLLCDIQDTLANLLNSKVLAYMHSKAAIPSTKTYSADTIKKVLELHTQINNQFHLFNTKLIACDLGGMCAQAACAVGLCAAALYLYNYTYKKYRPTATLYNPLKLWWPEKFGDKRLDGTMYFEDNHIPLACSISE